MTRNTQATQQVPIASDVLDSFSRHGLPGLVIGAQFIIIAALLWFGLGTVKDATKAMADTTAALHELSQTIKETQWTQR